MTDLPRERLKIFDVVVIGGGISGLGVALKSSKTGLSTILIEKDRVAGATSNNSLRIIHGGFRYLQSLNMPRVLQSIRAQNELLSLFPELIVPLPCLMPLNKVGLKSKLPICVALFIFKILSAADGCKGAIGHKNKILSSKDVEAAVTIMKGLAPNGALLWWDALVLDPQALAQRLVAEIRSNSATVREGEVVLDFSADRESFVTKTAVGSNLFSVYSNTIVDTRGPWNPSHKNWCKAYNVVVKKVLDPKYAIAIESAKGRLYFAVPRGNECAIGTQYSYFEGDPAKAMVSEQEIEEFINDFSNALPNAKLTIADVARTECGVLPANGPNDETLVGTAKIINQHGLVSVLSTKYTTFLTQAEKVLQILKRHLSAKA